MGISGGNKVVMVGSPIGRAGGSLFTNPVGGNILADTGPLPAGIYLFKVLLGSSVAVPPHNIPIAHYDAGDAATLFNYPNGVAANEVMQIDFEAAFAENERLKIMCVIPVTGVLRSCITYHKIG